MKKKLLIAMLTLTTAVLLASCASGGTQTSAGSASSTPEAATSSQESTAETSAASGESTTSEAASEATANEPVSAPSVDQRRVYVTPDWVKSVIDGTQEGYEDYVIAEVVYADAADPTADGYVPGAIRVYDVDVEDAEGTQEAPYNLLAAETVEENMLKHGITKDTKVILYGDDISGVGRVAYGMLWLGVEDVKILNGGLSSWKAAGYDTVPELAAETAATSFGTAVPAHPEYWVSMDEAKTRLKSDETFKLVSIRAEDEWLGKTSGYSYIPKAGEPEGAVWGKGAQTAADVADFTNSDGTVKELDELEAVWADCDFDVDSDQLAFYCGTGWRACPPFLVMYQEGHDNIAVYDGGWYEWQMYDDNPVQVGDPASSDCKHTTVGELSDDKAAAE